MITVAAVSYVAPAAIPAGMAASPVKNRYFALQQNYGSPPEAKPAAAPDPITTVDLVAAFIA